MAKAKFFIECSPNDGALIKYSKYNGNEDIPTLSPYAQVGRWNEDLGAIITKELRLFYLHGKAKAGYCWQYAEGELVLTTFVEKNS